MVMLGEKKSLSGAMNAKAVGSGTETLVLAHGYGTDQSIWDKVVPELADKYQVVVFDWNFAGSKDKAGAVGFDPVRYSSLEAYSEDLINLMDEMGIKDCVLVGHSMSAMIGCIASVKRPHLFKHLILIGASPRYLNAEGYEGGFERADVDQILSAIESNFDGWVSAFAPMAVGNPNDIVSVDKFEGCLRAMRPDIALAVAKLIFLGDYRSVLEDVTAPCTVVQMKTDAVVPASVPYYIQAKLKVKSSVEMVNVDGHFPMLTAPSLLLHAVDKALAGNV
ncbi:hypothetical protein V2J09_018777 [Rumex salicifolius]